MEKFLLFFLIVLIYTFLLVAQTSQIDVIYLKDGRIIKGIIVEQIIDRGVKIKTNDKLVFEFNNSEILKIAKENLDNTNNERISSAQKSNYKEHAIGLSVNIGLSQPVGDFASANSGMAETGFSLGLGYLSPQTGFSFTSNILIAINGLDKDEAQSSMNSAFSSYGSGSIDVGSWKTIWILGGAKFSSEIAPTVNLFELAQIGAFCGYLPEIDFTFNTEYGNLSATQASAWATAFAYSIGMGITFDKYYLAIYYYAADPEFTENATARFNGNSYSASANEKLPARIISLTLGMIF